MKNIPKDLRFTILMFILAIISIIYNINQENPLDNSKLIEINNLINRKHIAFIQPNILYVSNDTIIYNVVVKNSENIIVSDIYPLLAKNFNDLIIGIDSNTIKRKNEIINEIYPYSEFTIK